MKVNEILIKIPWIKKAYCRINMSFFKFPNLKNKYSTVSELYEYIFSNPDKISFNENNLINILRRKKTLGLHHKLWLTIFAVKIKVFWILQ